MQYSAAGLRNRKRTQSVPGKDSGGKTSVCQHVPESGTGAQQPGAHNKRSDAAAWTPHEPLLSTRAPASAQVEFCNLCVFTVASGFYSPGSRAEKELQELTF
uniref:Uncharacterized protein n=1 Tax=Knipowitschia caucasica TaxID=637954 RepID=A0AAV2JCI2_KNICA